PYPNSFSVWQFAITIRPSGPKTTIPSGQQSTSAANAGSFNGEIFRGITSFHSPQKTGTSGYSDRKGNQSGGAVKKLSSARGHQGRHFSRQDLPGSSQQLNCRQSN